MEHSVEIVPGSVKIHEDLFGFNGQGIQTVNKSSLYYPFEAVIDSVRVKGMYIVCNSPSKSNIYYRFRFDKPITKHPDYKVIKELLEMALDEPIRQAARERYKV